MSYAPKYCVEVWTRYGDDPNAFIWLQAHLETERGIRAIRRIEWREAKAWAERLKQENPKREFRVAFDQS